MDNDTYELCIKKQKKKLIPPKTWDELASELGWSKGEVLRCAFKKEKKKKGIGCTTIMVAGDTHFPEQLDLTGQDTRCDILVLNGDLIDHYGISSFKKSKPTDFMEELVKFRQFLIQFIMGIKPKTCYINFGNHEYRWFSYIQNQLQPDVLGMMPDNILEMIVDDGFHIRDRKAGTKVYYQPIKEIITKTEVIYTREWYCRIGNTIFCHPKAYGRSPMKTSEQVYQWFKLQKEFYDIDCFVVSHTHKQGIYRYGDSFLYEIGALCKEPEYSKGGSLIRPQNNGFLLLSQNEDGSFNYGKTRLICL